MIKEFLNNYLLLPHVDIAVRVILIPFVTLGIIYGFGRLLEIVHDYKTKNRLAFLIIIILSYFSGNFEVVDKLFIMDVVTIASLSNIIYVTVCWRFYYRMDNFLSSKIASSQGFRLEKRKKKDKK